MPVSPVGTLNTRLHNHHVAYARLTVDRETLCFGSGSPVPGMAQREGQIAALGMRPGGAITTGVSGSIGGKSDKGKCDEQGETDCDKTAHGVRILLIHMDD